MYLIKSMQSQNNDSQSKSNLQLVAAAFGFATPAAFFGLPEDANAITVTDVNTELAAVVTNTGTAADAAFPIGASILALGCIGYAIKRFIMAN